MSSLLPPEHHIKSCLISVGLALRGPLFQIPIFISVYKGVSEMAALPVASMQSGGLLWFSDLTVYDPYFALPLVTAATMFITIEVRMTIYLMYYLLQ